MNYVDSTGVMIFALLPDGSLLLRPLAAPPAGTDAGLKLCDLSGTLGVVDFHRHIHAVNLRTSDDFPGAKNHLLLIGFRAPRVAHRRIEGSVESRLRRLEAHWNRKTSFLILRGQLP